MPIAGRIGTAIVAVRRRYRGRARSSQQRCQRIERVPMSLLTLKRSGLSLLFVALVSGCASGGTGGTAGADSGEGAGSADHSASAAAPATKTCKANRSACKYEGAYERGEANYAELEARRLNQAALQRFRDAIK